MKSGLQKTSLTRQLVRETIQDTKLQIKREIFSMNLKEFKRAREEFKRVQESKLPVVDKKILSISLNNLLTERNHINVRIRHSLGKMNIQTIGELLPHRREEFLSLRQLGENSIRELENILATYNLRLGMEFLSH